MKNSVQANIAFNFKGEEIKASTDIDLDMFFQANEDVSFVYNKLAKSIGLDEHRHEYDVMVMADIGYSEPKGLAETYVVDESMDWVGLEKAYQGQTEFNAIADLASSYFSAEELEANPQLLAALTQAYKQNK